MRDMWTGKRNKEPRLRPVLRDRRRGLSFSPFRQGSAHFVKPESSVGGCESKLAGIYESVLGGGLIIVGHTILIQYIGNALLVQSISDFLVGHGGVYIFGDIKTYVRIITCGPCIIRPAAVETAA